MTIRALINRLSSNQIIDWDTQITVVVYTNDDRFSRELQPEDVKIDGPIVRIVLNVIGTPEEVQS